MDKIILLIITGALLILSFIKDRNKTKTALTMALKKMKNIGLPILLTVVIISMLLQFFPKERISELLSEGNSLWAVLSSALVGSAAVLPGFIAFPLGGVLKDSGIPYMVISAFTSSLMMVGIATLPVEKKYLGMRVALLRNAACFLMAIVTAVVTGLAYGELFG